MDSFREDVWNPAYREAVKEILDPQVTYTTQQELNLAKLADEGAWEPSENILSLVPHAKRVDVQIIGPQTDLNALDEDLLEQGAAGIVVMGPYIGRKSKPSLIILVTELKYYAIDPDDDEIGIKFLKLKLQEKKVKFWTTNGLNEADCLNRHYDINLMEANATCCTGLHLYMMKNIFHWPTPRRMMFSPAVVKRCIGKFCLERFGDLVEMWLDIDAEEIEFNPAQLIHLSTRPLSQTAINLIRKRCTLVLPLARALDYESYSDVRAISGAFYKILSNGPRIEQLIERSKDLLSADEDSRLKVGAALKYLLGLKFSPQWSP